MQTLISLRVGRVRAKELSVVVSAGESPDESEVKRWSKVIRRALLKNPCPEHAVAAVCQMEKSQPWGAIWKWGKSWYLNTEILEAMEQAYLGRAPLISRLA